MALAGFMVHNILVLVKRKITIADASAKLSFNDLYFNEWHQPHSEHSPSSSCVNSLRFHLLFLHFAILIHAPVPLYKL